MNETRKLSFLIRKHSCFLNHTNIILRCHIYPCSTSCYHVFLLSPPHMGSQREVKRSTGHFTPPPPHAQYDHYRLGIKWGWVSYGVQSSIATWGAVTLPLYFPSQLVRLFFIKFTLFGRLYAIGPPPTPRGPGGRPLYPIRCTIGYLAYGRKLY